MSDTRDLETVRRIIRDRLRDRKARVYLFGSWAGGRPSRSSDIDIGVLPSEPLPAGELARIREELEESHILCTVDLVDLSETTEEFRRRVMEEGVSWSD